MWQGSLCFCETGQCPSETPNLAVQVSFYLTLNNLLTFLGYTLKRAMVFKLALILKSLFFSFTEYHASTFVK